jgi:hypothetical protein
MEPPVLATVIRQAEFTLGHSAASTWDYKISIKLTGGDEEGKVDEVGTRNTGL